ncbi:MAG: hypothetical protein V4613_11095 [Bacteroidota bacterium]
MHQIKKISFLLFIYMCIELNAQQYDPSFYPYRNSIKATLLSTTGINYSSYKLTYERHFPKANSFIDIEGGYVNYSREDYAACTGYYTSASIGGFIRNKHASRTSIKISPFYQTMYLNDYLLFRETAPPDYDYLIYRKANLKKERYGMSLINTYMRYIGKKISIEVYWGIGFIHFKTTAPDETIQKTYRNGLSYGKEYACPNFLIGLKSGYHF